MTKQTARNNEFLKSMRAIWNDAFYKHILKLTNEQGKRAAMEYAIKNVRPETRAAFITRFGMNPADFGYGETPAAETSERARITPAEAVTLLGDDESAPEWTPAVGDTVRIKDNASPEDARGLVGEIYDADNYTDERELPYYVVIPGWYRKSEYFARTEIELVTPAPREPLGELEALREGNALQAIEIDSLRWKVDRLEYHLREIKRILAEEVSWQQAPFIRDLMEDLEL